jgi:dUTP pyrophosphatase
MQRVLVKKLLEAATLPTVAHPGEDLAYDVYAFEDMVLPLGETIQVRTGVAMQAERIHSGSTVWGAEKFGLIVKDRSSMAKRGIVTRGGVIDAGYTGEIVIFMTNTKAVTKVYESGHPMLDDFVAEVPYQIKAGDKIAQLIPIPVLTGKVIEVKDFEQTARGANGFGSSGR